jgi:hypothetical protein
MVRLNYHYLLFLILCFPPTLCFGQDVYDGQVINSVTDIAIPSVTVKLLKEKVATQTNERGYFSLAYESHEKNDTLQFTCVGYKPFKLPVSAYLPHVLIALEASNTELNEVLINNKKVKQIILGRFFNYDLKNSGRSNLYYHVTQVIAQRTLLAKLFTAPQANAILTSIALGRQDLPTSPTYAIRNKYTNFLIHVIAEDPDVGGPGDILFTKTVSLSDNSARVDIDVSKELIVIPGINFFVAIEWLITPYNEIIAVSNSPKLDWVTKRGYQMLKDASEYRVSYQPFLIGYMNEKTLKPAVLYTKVGRSWQATQGYDPWDLALSATVHY